MKKLSSVLLSAILLLMVLLTACQSESGGADSSSSQTSSEVNAGSAETVSYPITIQHVYGETVIESKPAEILCPAAEAYGR